METSQASETVRTRVRAQTLGPLCLVRKYPASLMAAGLATLLLVAPAAMAQRPLGIDVSFWQGTITQAQWNQVFASGRVFAFIKSTQGTLSSYDDVKFVANVTNGRTAGLYTGAYHFAQPDLYTALNEANHFVDVAGPYMSAGYLRPVLDLERSGSTGSSSMSAWVNTFMDRVQTRTGHEPILYTSLSFINQLDSTVLGRDLWIAWPVVPEPNPQTTNPSTGAFSTWAFWQYSWEGAVPGISGNVDLDVFNGTILQLQAFVIPGGSRAPMISVHPADKTVETGGAATFYVMPTGTATLNFQWQKNNVNITNGGHYSGCTTPTMTVSNCSSSEAASYRCVVTNSYGTATSNSALLTLTGQSTTFIVESRAGGLNNGNYSEFGTWNDGTSKSSATGCTSGIGHRWCTIGATAVSATYTFTPASTGTWQVFTTNCTTSNSGNPLIHKVTHSGGTANVGVCQNTTCSPNAVNTWYSLGQYVLNSGTTYSVTLDGSTAAGSSPASSGAGRSDAIRWVLVASTLPSITQQPTAQNVCPNTTATFTVAASGTGTLTYQWQKNQANITNGGHYSNATTSTLSVSNASAADAANYRCVVSNSNGGTNSNEAGLTLKAATTITSHPANKTIIAGQSATFTVAATGEGTLSYQWQKNGSNITNGGHYSGCTTASLAVSGADSNDVTSYRCVVTGGCGSATSNPATLALTVPGDFDQDDDIDQRDYGVLQSCLAVTNPPGDPTCASADLNADNAINGLDVNLFIGCMSGPEIPASLNCTAGN